MHFYSYPQNLSIWRAVVYLQLIAHKNKSPFSCTKDSGRDAILLSSNCWYLIATYYLCSIDKDYTPLQGLSEVNCHGGSIITTSNNWFVNDFCNFPKAYFTNYFIKITAQSKVRTSALIGIHFLLIPLLFNRLRLVIIPILSKKNLVNYIVDLYQSFDKLFFLNALQFLSKLEY